MHMLINLTHLDAPVHVPVTEGDEWYCEGLPHRVQSVLYHLQHKNRYSENTSSMLLGIQNSEANPTYPVTVVSRWYDTLFSDITHSVLQY